MNRSTVRGPVKVCPLLLTDLGRTWSVCLVGVLSHIILSPLCSGIGFNTLSLTFDGMPLYACKAHKGRHKQALKHTALEHILSMNGGSHLHQAKQLELSSRCVQNFSNLIMLCGSTPPQRNSKVEQQLSDSREVMWISWWSTYTYRSTHVHMMNAHTYRDCGHGPTTCCLKCRTDVYRSFSQTPTPVLAKDQQVIALGHANQLQRITTEKLCGSYSPNIVSLPSTRFTMQETLTLGNSETTVGLTTFASLLPWQDEFYAVKFCMRLESVCSLYLQLVSAIICHCKLYSSTSTLFTTRQAISPGTDLDWHAEFWQNIRDKISLACAKPSCETIAWRITKNNHQMTFGESLTHVYKKLDNKYMRDRTNIPWLLPTLNKHMKTWWYNAATWFRCLGHNVSHKWFAVFFLWTKLVQFLDNGVLWQNSGRHADTLIFWRNVTKFKPPLLWCMILKNSGIQEMEQTCGPQPDSCLANRWAPRNVCTTNLSVLDHLQMSGMSIFAEQAKTEVGWLTERKIARQVFVLSKDVKHGKLKGCAG